MERRAVYFSAVPAAVRNASAYFRTIERIGSPPACSAACRNELGNQVIAQLQPRYCSPKKERRGTYEIGEHHYRIAKVHAHPLLQQQKEISVERRTDQCAGKESQHAHETAQQC